MTSASLMVRLLWVMAMNWVVAAHLGDEAGEAADVGLVEGGVDFVEDAEGGGLELEDADQEREGGEGLFAAAERGGCSGAFCRGARRRFRCRLRCYSFQRPSVPTRRMKAWPPPKSLVKVWEKFSLMTL